MRGTLKIILLAVSAAIMAPLSAEEPLIWNGFDLNNPKDVLQLQEDSRWVRELNNEGGELQKKAFQETLGAMQQKANTAATSAMTEKFKNDPRYKDVTFIHDEFSTPGANTSTKINTDYDVRFGYKDSRGNFIECCRGVAEEAFYKSWSQQTGGPPADADLKAHLHHAEKSRFLVTDRWHMEAPRDFTDQNRKAVSNFTMVKESQAKLLDPEDFGRVYHEKADEQFRQARAIEQQLKNDSSLTPNQQTALVEKMKSHQAEGVMQVKKGIQALDASRASYARQGYEVGQIPDSLRSQMDAVLSFQGTKSDDVDAMMKRLGGGDMADGFNQKVSSQIESLKWSKKNPSPPKSSGLATHLKVGSAAGMLGDVLSIEQRLKQADQGSNWFLNFEEGDSEAEKKAKAVAIAAAEILPHGPMDLLDRGFTVDEKIKSIIELRVKQGKPISNAEIGVLVVGGAMVETTKRLIVDPVTPIAEASAELLVSASDALDRMKEASNRQASEDLARETHTAALAFQNMIDLGAIEATRISGQGSSRHFSGFDVSPEDMLVLEIASNAQWDNSLIVQWAIKDAKKSVIASPAAKTVSDPSSLKIQLASTFLKRLSPGQYTAQVNISDPVSGRTAYERHEFAIGDYFAFGSLQVLDDTDQPRTGSLQPGDRLKVSTARQGSWDDRYVIEWFFNGEKIKEVSAGDPKAHYVVMGLDPDIKGVKEVAVRAVDPDAGANWRVAYQSLKVKIASASDLSDFEILAFKDKVGGAVLDGPVRNGEVLAFAASVPSEGSQEEPFIGDLSWQLFDPSGQPVEGINKYQRKIERGGILQSSYEFSGNSLANGVYTITLTHSDANDPTRRYQAQTSIEFFEPVWVTDIWATKTRGGESPETSFKTGDEIFLYASFEVGKGVTELERTLLVRDTKTGDIVAQVKDRFTPKVASGADRTAIKLARNQFRAGDTLEFVASLAGVDESPVERSVSFNVEQYQMSIKAPKTLQLGASAALSIVVPTEFRPPYSFDIRGNGLSVSGFSGSSTKGTIRARSSAFSSRGNTTLVAKVTDADGRISPTVSLDISVVPPPPPQPKIIPSTPSPAPSAVAETADRDNPWEELRDQLIDIQTRYYQDKAAAEAESQRRQDEINAKYNNLLPPPPPPPWMSGSSNTGSSCTCGIKGGFTPDANLSRSPAGGYTPGQSWSIVYDCCGRHETHTAVTDNKGFPRINGQFPGDFFMARRKQCGCK